MSQYEAFDTDGEDMILPDDFDPNSETYEPTDVDTDDDTLTTEYVVENDYQVSDEAAATDTQPTTTEVPEAVPQTPTVKVKFNHEERELGLDEAALYAQKGMNYDKLEERVKSYETSLANSNRLAKKLGYDSVDEMIQAANQNYIERQVRELMDAGNTEAMARFLVQQQNQADEAAYNAPAVEPPAQAPARPTISESRQAELQEFVKAYPGVTTLPDEVIKANQNGVRLLVAYERFKNKAALDELAILKQNQASAAKAPVTGATGKAAPVGNEVEDLFLKGFDSDSW